MLRAVTAGFMVIVALGIAVVVYYKPTQAWTIEQTIEATKGFRAVYMSGRIEGWGDFELWVRSRQNQAQMQKMLFRSGNGLTVWIQGNSTYYYSRGDRIVYTDDAQTAGFSHWPGAKLFETIRAAGIGQVRYAKDPQTGQQKAVVQTSVMDVKGPQSLILEFDVSTKMLLSIHQWTNLHQLGKPNLESEKIVYFEDLPDDIFSVELPAGVRYQAKDVSVADEMLGLLALPQYGISLPGETEEEACRMIVEEMWKAVIGLDLARLRQLCPGTAAWNDDLLRTIMSGIGGQDAVVEVMQIGEPVRRGQSRLGPVMVVPSRVRHRDGKIHEEKMIILLRSIEGVPHALSIAATASRISWNSR